MKTPLLITAIAIIAGCTKDIPCLEYYQCHDIKRGNFIVTNDTDSVARQCGGYFSYYKHRCP
jgi:hypothetical protein